MTIPAMTHISGTAGTILVLGNLGLCGCTADLSAWLWPERAPAQVSLADVFQDPVSYRLDRAASSLNVADLDGDGSNDLLVIADPNSSAIGVLLNRGAAGFDPPQYTDLPYPGLRATTGDVNADAAADVVLIHDTVGVILLLSRGDGTFDDPRYLPSSLFPNEPLLTDLDLDGHLDLVVVYSGNENVAVSLNDGSGGLRWPRFYHPPGGASFRGAVGDIDGDGYPDLLVVSKGLGPGYLFRNQGDGTFAPPVVFGSDIVDLADVVPVDLDADGRLDLIVQGSEGIFVLHNDGGGTLTRTWQLSSAALPTVLAADFTGDGAPDLVLGQYLLVNRGDGTSLPLVDLELSFRPGSPVAGDVNGDGRPDLAGITDDGITVLLARTDTAVAP